MQDKRESKYIVLVAGFLSLTGYFLLGYVLERHQTLPLIGVYAALFATYLWLLHLARDTSSQFLITSFAFSSRLLLIISVPVLSDDVYRFLWDGHILLQGETPFALTPRAYMDQQEGLPPDILSTLYPLLNSPEYHTVYPPVCQGIFYLAAKLSPHSLLGGIVLIRLFILLAEGLTLTILPNLLRRFDIDPSMFLFYALNPLVILEFTGNLHFEAWLIAFLVLAIYLWNKHKTVLSGIALGAGIAVKLLPLMLLPVFLRRARPGRVVLLYFSVAFTTLLLFLPLLNPELVNGITESTSLYFKKFEFNASLYYLVRQVGYWYKGYNIIGMAGVALAALAGAGILVFSLLRRQQIMPLPVVFMWVFFIYFICSTTLHPWYITTLLPLSLFSRWRFPVVWTGMIFLTYAGYSANGFRENLWLTLLEYAVVFGYLIYEAGRREILLGEALRR